VQYNATTGEEVQAWARRSTEDYAAKARVAVAADRFARWVDHLSQRLGRGLDGVHWMFHPQVYQVSTWAWRRCCSPASPQIPVSCFSSRKLNVGLETWLSKGGSQRQITFMGADSTTDKETTALSTPMNVFWRCEHPFYIRFSRRYQRPPLLRFRDSADCLRICVTHASPTVRKPCVCPSEAIRVFAPHLPRLEALHRRAHIASCQRRQEGDQSQGCDGEFCCSCKGGQMRATAGADGPITGFSLSHVDSIGSVES